MIQRRRALNQLIKEKVDVLSAGLVIVMLVGMIFIGVGITIYVLLFTQYWYVAVIYLIWIYVIDKDTPEGVGRPSNWFKSWRLFKHATDYFPVRIHLVPGASLDPNHNYLACSFPHGVFPIGLTLGFQTHALGNPLGIKCTTYGITLKTLFYVPIYRELILALGLCSANAKSIQRILSRPGGGNIAGLIPGGTREMFYKHGEYKIVLKDRKGFVKIAIRTGAQILPVFSFGETSIYKQKIFPTGSLIRRAQEWLKVKIGFPPVLFYGRGYSADSVGIFPLPSPINVVVGEPVEVTKIENPTQEDIDKVHQVFVERLTALFEEYKYKFESNPNESSLIIV